MCLLSEQWRYLNDIEPRRKAAIRTKFVDLWGKNLRKNSKLLLCKAPIVCIFSQLPSMILEGCIHVCYHLCLYRGKNTGKLTMLIHLCSTVDFELYLLCSSLKFFRFKHITRLKNRGCCEIILTKPRCTS
jgi:hypothetical protein